MTMPQADSKTHRYMIAIRPYAVWLCRLLVGGTFIFSGIVKTIDPWGFIFKITEYLNVWHITWLWQESVMTLAVGISIAEFCAGVLLLTGCLRRAVSWFVFIFMLFMLPLTAYIAIYNPVADCGCFGDALVISNTGTFVKNVVLTIAIIYLLYNNKKVDGLYIPLVQWMVMVASIFYCLVIAFIGIAIQPMIDFRPYREGTALSKDIDDEITLVYEKDGVRHEFALDALPDSTWTYVGRNETTTNPAEKSAFAIFDGDDDVTSEVISTDGPQVLLVVNAPETHKKARASMANNINDYIHKYGGTMVGIVAASGKAFDTWEKEAHPHYEAYTCDDTTTKELVRGDAGLVYLVDGVIKWKRNIYSLSGDFPDFSLKENQLDRIRPWGLGQQFTLITCIYAGVLFIILVMGTLRIRKYIQKKRKKRLLR